MSAPRQLVTLAVRELLSRHRSLKVYAGFIPEQGQLPLAVLHSIPGGSYSGPVLTDPEADTFYEYQVDVVGSRMDQVEKGADELRDLVLGRGPGGEFKHALEVVPGFGWVDRLPTDTPGGVDVEKAPSGTVFTASNRYTVVLTPSE